MVFLPPEVILHIINCLIPSPHPVVFPPSDPVTHTLLSLTLVSRFTLTAARKLLIKHCLYIDCTRRFNEITSLKRKSEINPITVSPIGLFLAPYPGAIDESPKIATDIRFLLPSIKNTLTRLVIDIPLRSLYPEDDEISVRPKLRAAFLELIALEEFCSAQDELYLATDPDGSSEPGVWSFWPRLKRLALYNPDVAHIGFLEGLKKCPKLTHLILTRSDGLVNFPDFYFEHPGLTRLERVTIVNSVRARFDKDQLVRTPGTFLGEIELAFRANNSVANAASDEEPCFGPFCTYFQVPASLNEEKDDIELCQDWVCRRAIDGSLWDLNGMPIFDR
ncbi:hypothetical protein PHISCL_00029 [Aspergillus sclerotialis]|uniref:F-box domain-containing protein n=1 Tax=Aspergillus sclerotialis TaxID=2070753 RepID=A0A3A3A7B6_9EURO|nr:hypothetical protein PHISCL_00029 [Aspergillus sclerotialis]